MTDLPALTVGSFRATSTGLVVNGRPPLEVWAAYGRGLGALAAAFPFVLGDWLNYGERIYGETYAQAATETGLASGTLMNMRWVMDRVAPSRRRESLTFRAHSDVASMEPSEQDRWLDMAEDKHWNSRELREAIQESKGIARLYRVAFTEAELVALAHFLEGGLPPEWSALDTACDKIAAARLAI